MLDIWTLVTKKCKCGCGQDIPFKSKYGEELFYAIGHYPKGEKSHLWRGGIKHKHGYLMRMNPDHPLADSQGYVREHVLVMEAHLGRHLTSDEMVHHINENKSDNRIENLKLMTKREHGQYHAAKRRDKLTGQFSRLVRKS